MEILKYAIGIDLAKDKFDVCISNIDQLQHVSIRAQCKFANTAKEFERFFSWVIKHIEPHIPCIFLMEATGIYYEQLAWFLHNKNCRIAVVLPNKAKKYKEALGLKSKNDRIDAKGLAQMACEQNNTEWKPLSSNIYLLRLITRQIQKLSEQATIVNNQLHALQHGMYRDKAIEKMYAKQLNLLEKNKDTLQIRVEQIVETDDVLKRKFSNICKIKGLGIQSLAVIVAETNGFAAFENIAQLVSYAGYDIVENQSGKRSGKTKISKKGNNRIRRCLHFPAFNVIKYQVAPFKNLHERVYEKSRIKMKAYTAVQKKLLEFIFTLWKKEEAFDPAYTDKTSRDAEPESSFTLVPKEPSMALKKRGEKQQKNCKKITPAITRVTQDKHPSKYRRMSSFT